MQEHTQFKLFSKEFKGDQSVQELLDEVEKWANDNVVGPKSIGVEYIESNHNILMTLGYRSDENYPVHLVSDMIGTVNVGGDYSDIEAGIATAAQKHANIICHEMFITAADELYMVFMNHE